MPVTQSGLPFVSGSDTSREAAVRAEAFSGQQLRTYLNWLIAKGPDGGTDKEAHRELGIARSSLCARRMELRGVIVDTGYRREHCGVYRIADAPVAPERPQSAKRGVYRRRATRHA